MGQFLVKSAGGLESDRKALMAVLERAAELEPDASEQAGMETALECLLSADERPAAQVVADYREHLAALRASVLAPMIGHRLMHWRGIYDENGLIRPGITPEHLDSFAGALEHSSIPEACEQMRDGAGWPVIDEEEL
jgi:hypothetical protein